MTLSSSAQHPLRIADARRSVRHVFVHDFELTCSIGVHAHEHNAPQRVRINLDLAVWEGDASISDDLDKVVCYEAIVNRTREIALDGHIRLVETLAERIASACLETEQVRSIRVRVEKLDVFSDVASVGVEIERFSELE